MTPGWLLSSRARVYVWAAMLAAALVEAYPGHFGVHAWPALTGGPHPVPCLGLGLLRGLSGDGGGFF